MKNPLAHRSLISLAWPLIITIGVGIALPVMDSLFLSIVSDAAAAGVGALGPVLFVLFTAIQSFSLAGANIAAQFQGAGLMSKARVSWNLQIILALGIGIAAMLIVWLLSGFLGKAMGLKGEALAASIHYLKVISPGMILKVFQTSLTNLANSQGLTKLNLASNILAVISNGFFNWIFISGAFGMPKLGVMGVAMGTTLSWIVMVLYLWFSLRNKMHLKPRKVHFRRGVGVVLPAWLRIGIPAAVEPVSFQLNQVAVTALVVRLGMLATTSRVYAANLALLPVIFSLGLGTATQTLIANQVGSQNFSKANSTLKKGLLGATSFALGIGFLVALTGPKLLGVFTDNPEVIILGSAALWVDMVLQPAKAANIVLTNALRSTGDSKFPAIVGSLMMWTIGISAVVGFGYGLKFGLVGLWAGMAFDEWTRFIVNLWRWKSGAWQNKGVIKPKT